MDAERAQAYWQISTISTFSAFVGERNTERGHNIAGTSQLTTGLCLQLVAADHAPEEQGSISRASDQWR